MKLSELKYRPPLPKLGWVVVGFVFRIESMAQMMKLLEGDAIPDPEEGDAACLTSEDALERAVKGSRGVTAAGEEEEEEEAPTADEEKGEMIRQVVALVRQIRDRQACKELFRYMAAHGGLAVTELQQEFLAEGVDVVRMLSNHARGQHAVDCDKSDEGGSSTPMQL